VGLGVDVIRRIFEHEDGVVKIASPERLHKRRYTTLRIPESVARRVHRRLTEVKGRPVRETGSPLGPCPRQGLIEVHLLIEVPLGIISLGDGDGLVAQRSADDSNIDALFQ
jgi:hypothetical protein